MSNIELRKVLGDSLLEIMEKDSRIVVLNADLCKAGGLQDIQKEFPSRAFNVGVAEANMVTIAAGMASYGYIPFVSSFSPFATRRVCDQLAISVCYAQLPVKIIGTDPGISAELNGGTHMGVEDIGVIRSLNTMVIYEPVDALQLKQAIPQIIEHDGPVYIRLHRKTVDDVFGDDYKFDLFSADVIKEGKDVTIFASGLMVQESIEALKLLSDKNIDAELINVHTIKPIDVDTIVRSAKKTGCVVTCENHSTIGGLYSAIAETLSREYPCPMAAIGMDNCFGEVGYIPYLKERFKMRKEDIAMACENIIKRKEVLV